jgi:hypothetical protein
MKTKNKTTNRSRQARRANRRCLGSVSTKTWVDSTRTRPKTVVLTLERTQSGYTVQEATILNRINQYGVVPVAADVRAITKDINTKGLLA